VVAAAMMGFVAFAVPLHAKTLPRLGLLGWTACDTALSSERGEWSFVLKGLAELGYRPQENIIIECRSANERFEQLKTAAAELARMSVDVIVASSNPAATEAVLATHKIPIISIQANLLGNSFSAPRGNITGIAEFNIELTGKRLEFLKEALPTLRRVGVLSFPAGFYRGDEARTRRAGEDLQTDLSFFRVKDPQGLAPAFADMKAQNVDAVFVLPSLMFASNASLIADLAIKYDLATMVPDYRMTKAGCLISYSSNADDLEHRLAYFVDRVLKGHSPEFIPSERPWKFVLSINLKTAKALGLSLPRGLLMMADEVVE
jgi:putative ABC transport system substrate-binding protein